MKKFIYSSAVGLIFSALSTVAISYYEGLEVLGRYSVYLMVVALAQSILSCQVPLLYNRRFSRMSAKLRSYILSIFSVYIIITSLLIYYISSVFINGNELNTLSLLLFGIAVSSVKSLIEIELRQKRRYVALTISSSLSEMAVLLYIVLSKVIDYSISPDSIFFVWTVFRLVYCASIGIREILLVTKTYYLLYALRFWMSSSRFIFVGLLKNLENYMEVIVFSLHNDMLVGAITFLKKSLGLSRFINVGIGQEISFRAVNSNQKEITNRNEVYNLFKLAAVSSVSPLVISLIIGVYFYFHGLEEYPDINLSFVMLVSTYIIFRFVDTSLRSLVTRALPPKVMIKSLAYYLYAYLIFTRGL